jgi:hypothetical protein
MHGREEEGGVGQLMRSILCAQACAIARQIHQSTFDLSIVESIESALPVVDEVDRRLVELSPVLCRDVSWRP